MQADPGFFGPESITWRVNRQMTVLFGGARALLLQAAHPLVAAGARQTGSYQRNPWQRLIRTVRLQTTVTFGTRKEAREAAEHINRVHRPIRGVDPVTGDRFDALDPDLLLWVHAALEESSVLYYERTVRPLSPAERERYHRESMLAAELVLLPRHRIPPTFQQLRAYLHDTAADDRLVVTEVAERVAEMIVRGEGVPPRIKPVWRLIAFSAVGMLPEPLRERYGFPWGPGRQALLDASLGALRLLRPLLPYRYRVIAPARWAERRLASDPALRFADQRR